MLRLFLIAIVCGLAASVPLNKSEMIMEKDTDSILNLESALLVPEFEKLTNSSVVFETMPSVKELVEQTHDFEEDVELTREREEIKTLKNMTTETELELEDLETELINDEKSLEKEQAEIIDEAMVDNKLEEVLMESEKKFDSIMDKIVDTLNRTENEILMNKTANMTLRLKLSELDLPLEERVELIGEQFNKTVHDEVLTMEEELLELNDKMEVASNKSDILEEDLEIKKVGTEKLVEKIKMNEMKFATMFERLNELKGNLTSMEDTLEKNEEEVNKEMKLEIEEEELVERVRRAYGMIIDEVENLVKEENLMGEKKMVAEELVSDIRESEMKMENIISNLPMAPAPTTESYGYTETTTKFVVPAPIETATQVLPMAPVPTTESYGYAETTTKFVVPAPIETATQVLPMAPVPTTESYGYTETASEEPEEMKYRQVRSVLDKITLYFQTKHTEMNEFIFNSYCRSDEKFQYYKSHPTDETKYVECNPWGKGSIKSCPEGRLWDQFHEICSIQDVFELGQNSTRDLLELESMEETLTNINCNNSDFTCVNGGKCVSVESGFECQCDRFFTGEFCQHRVIDGSIFSLIMTEKFNLTQFKEELISVGINNTLTNEEMTGIKELIKNTTHKELMNYLENFDSQELRYDTILNNLVESILEDIYPDAYYMSIFNASSHTLLDVVRTIPSLISYSRYSNERYSEVFFKYEEVLDKLVRNLNTTWTNVTLDATEYTRLSSHILNDTGVLDEIFSVEKKTSETIVDELKDEFNKTSEEITEFVLKMEGMRLEFIELMKKSPKTINMKLSELKDRKLVRELISIFDQLTINSAEIINSLFSYGFWMVTDEFALEF